MSFHSMGSIAPVQCLYRYWTRQFWKLGMVLYLHTVATARSIINGGWFTMLIIINFQKNAVLLKHKTQEFLQIAITDTVV